MPQLQREDDALPLSFESPESGTIHGASYDPDARRLVIEFRGHGPEDVYRTYIYEGVEPVLWQEFLTAPSKGQFFSARIRPWISGRRV